MAKKPTITTITSTNNTVSTLNANFAALRNAFDNFLSRDGETPNAMNADLDLNSNDILNIQELSTNLLVLGGRLVVDLAYFPRNKGEWTTATEYEVFDMVEDGNNGADTNDTYLCVDAHLSGDWATDLADGKWELWVKGIDEADVKITGGFIEGTPIGDSNPAFGGFTDLEVTQDAVITGTLEAGGTTINGTLEVTGEAEFISPVTLELDDIVSTSQLAISQGGTGENNAADALEALGGVPKVQKVVVAGTTLTLDDTHLSGNVIVFFTSDSSITVTVPDGLVGTEPVTLVAMGHGLVTLLPSSTTIRSKGGDLTLTTKYVGASLIPYDTDEYVLIGDLTT